MVAVLASVAMVLHAASALASTVVVGDASCNPGPKHYATIQEAVNAVPVGSTVLVCPGTYPEQVVITQSLTLKGFTDGTSGAAVITAPPTGLVANVTTAAYGLAAAQLALQNPGAGPIRISNLTIDGAGGGCPAGASHTIGIDLYNVGDASFTHTGAYVQNVVVRNQIDGCWLGEGIVVENSFATVANNVVHNVVLNGITQIGGNTIFDANSVQDCGSSGIQVSNATQGVSAVVNNTVGSVHYGIVLDAGTTGAQVKNNTVGVGGSTGTLIDIAVVDGAMNNVVTSNSVSAAWTGIYLQNTGENMVQFNNITHLSYYGITDQDSRGGNTITSNTISEAQYGLYRNNSGTDVLSPNTISNAVVTSNVP
jgi:parallel beta-helix repeat protein